MSKLTRLPGTVLSFAFRPLAANPAFFFFMYLLGFTSHMAEVPFDIGGVPYDLLETELFIDVYALCVVLCVVPLRFRRVLRGVCYALAYPITLVDVWCYVTFDSALTPSLLMLAGETNGNEASEFLASYLNADVLLSPVGLVLLILAVHLCFNIAATVMRRKGISLCPRLPDNKRRRILIDDAVRTATALAGLAAACLFIWGCVQCRGNKAAMLRIFVSADTIGKVENELTRSDRAVLYLPAYRLAFSIYANMLAAKQIDRLIETADKAAVDSCSFKSSNIVFIIGESYNRHHSQLYGYDKATAPMQTERHSKGELIRFDDVVSPWNLTSFVFKLVFSLYSVGDKGEWCDYPLFPELFRSAGYHVTFLTNQFIPKTREAVYDFSGGFFLNNATLSKAQFDTRNTRLHKFDDGLLTDYDSLASGISAPRLTIFHLMGQHVDYRERVPQERKIYGPRDYKRPRLNRKERWIMADYDNATRYNDSIVDAILKRHEHENAIVIYMPDHGEECYGNDIHTHGRLHSAAIDYRLAHEEFEIPFWIWCSESYSATHPDIVREVERASRLPFMTDRMPHMLLYLAGISCPAYREELNPLSPKYDAGRARILKNTTDYNILKMQNDRKHAAE